MKENNNKGSMIILTIIGIATLLVAVIGATFAYFSVTVKYKTEKTPAVVETSTMLITFETQNKLEYKGAIPGRPSLSTDPVAQNINNTLTFTLTSATNMTIDTKYNIYLVIDNNDEAAETLTEEQLKSNDFITDNLVYLIRQNRNVSELALSNGTAGTDGSQYFPSNGLGNLYIEEDIDGDENTPNEYVGVIKSNLKFGGPNFDEDNKDRILIATGNLGSHATIETWTLEVWLRETGQEQNEDQGKMLKAHIEVEPIDQDPITYEPNKVTTP